MKRLKQILLKARRKHKKVRVYALVGKTGTGKSFRALLVMEKYGIELMIDDGLLIRDQRILAGRSAKREENKVTAIKRAIFENPVYAEEVKDALRKERFRSVLIIGTSEKMVGRIAERLSLPYPDEIIYIEDIATKDEISGAKESRQLGGKHVIPVPVIEVRQDPSHRILDSIKIFLKTRPFLFWKKRTVEKTVVQPPFSRRGRLSLSEAALSQMIMHCVEEYAREVEILKIIIDTTANGYRVEVKLRFPYGMSISNTLGGLQEYIVSNVERFSGIYIEKLDLTVDRIEKSAKKSDSK